jgi:hypothetical protein
MLGTVVGLGGSSYWAQETPPFRAGECAPSFLDILAMFSILEP